MVRYAQQRVQETAVAVRFVLLVALILAPTASPTQRPVIPVATLASIIVKMKHYENVENHERAIAAALSRAGLHSCHQLQLLGPAAATLQGHRCDWAVKKRQNPAVRVYPTDFLVLLAPRDELHVIKAALLGQEDNGLSVDSLREEQVMTRKLSAAPIAAHTLGSIIGSNMTTPPPFDAEVAWRRGFYGQGVRVAVFDTGIPTNHSNFEEEIERTNWTDEREQYGDKVGHGTFVASLIAGTNTACPGIAPKAQIVTFRVFTGTQVSYTSWFLDAFNYALYNNIDILNLSIGGPDSSDEPFVDKINELTAAGIIVVSAIGNDGPLYGTLNNPADMPDVIGVGGIDHDGKISSFSSRGMTNSESNLNFPSYGRLKPDLVAHARSLSAQGTHHTGACTKLSGTSVASPVVAATVALMISAVDPALRKAVVNPASIKKALFESSNRLPNTRMFEQGAGLLNIPNAVEAMRESEREYVWLQLRNKSGRPKVGRQAALFPSFLDLSDKGCPYMWPFCSQPLYTTGVTTTVNVTILNPEGIKGRLIRTDWIAGPNADLLDVSITPPARFWPWVAGVGVHLLVKPSAMEPVTLYGVLRLTIGSDLEGAESVVELPIRATIIPKPPKDRRILYDSFHNLQYPPAYIPRDSLRDNKDMLDWLGDHPHTNFNGFYQALRNAGYFVEVWSQPLLCLGRQRLKEYGFLLLIDTEDFFFEQEIDLIEEAVLYDSLNVVVAAEWYNAGVIESVGFMDDNTRSYWRAVIGGGNIPGLNQALDRFGIQLSDFVVSGQVGIGNHRFAFESGSTVAKAPAGSELLFANVFKHDPGSRKSDPEQDRIVVLSRTMPTNMSGSVLVYGDSHCLDTVSGSLSSDRCYTFFIESLLALTEKTRLGGLTTVTPSAYSDNSNPPRKLPNQIMSLFEVHSRTLGAGTSSWLNTDAICYQHAAGSVIPTSKTEAIPEFRENKVQFSYGGRPQSTLMSYSYMSATSSIQARVLVMTLLLIVLTVSRVTCRRRKQFGRGRV